MAVPVQQQEDLGSIRNFSNLLTGREEDTIWVRNLTYEQSVMVEVKTIPNKQLYYLSGDRLFREGSLLPDRGVPPVKWVPLQEGLPVRLPALNYNYFGVQQKVGFPLVPSTREQQAMALITDAKTMATILEGLSAVRLKPLRWALADDKAVIIGKPLLPLNGEVFWQHGHFLIPAGYEPVFPDLSGPLADLINPGSQSWVIWNGDGSYWKLGKSALMPLTIGSVRASLKH